MGYTNEQHCARPLVRTLQMNVQPSQLLSSQWHLFPFLNPLCEFSSPTMQADLFEYLCLEAQQHRREVELNALEPQVGSDPLTPPQLSQIQEARQQHLQQEAASQRQAAIHRQAAVTPGVTQNAESRFYLC